MFVLFWAFVRWQTFVRYWVFVRCGELSGPRAALVKCSAPRPTEPSRASSGGAARGVPGVPVVRTNVWPSGHEANFLIESASWVTVAAGTRSAASALITAAQVSTVVVNRPEV